MLAAFGALSVVTAGQGYFARRATTEELSPAALVGVGVASWVSWLALTPVVIAVGRRVPFSRAAWPRALVVHLLVLLAYYVTATLALLWMSTPLLAPSESVTVDLVVRTLLTSSRLSLAIFTYATVLVSDRLLATREQLRTRELQATRLAQQATEARLDALAARLEPHFLFNALQSVSALVDADPPRARTMLAQLGDLLRDALSSQGSGDVTLQEEIRLLERYLAIEQVRFADRLQVEWRIAPDTLPLAVPRFLLQPIVENAIRHGLTPSTVGGTVRISSARTGTRMRLVVWNDGAPLSPQSREGVGITTTRERLRTRFGEHGVLTLDVESGCGLSVVLDVPAVSVASAPTLT